jgi:integrase/recombinase XerC
MSALAIVQAPEMVEGEIVLANDSLATVPASPTTYPRILHLPDPANTPDLVGKWLSRRSEHTTRAYTADLKTFFRSFPEYDETIHDINQIAAEFCGWPRTAKVQKLEEYKSQMLLAGRAEATVNRQLSAIKSLLNLAFKQGIGDCEGRGLVDGERVIAYRDTKGIDGKLVPKLLKLPVMLHGEGTIEALRDECILRLLAENGVRRGTIHLLDVGDFTVYNRELKIREKAKGTQKRTITISHPAVKAIHDYLLKNGHVADLKGPLIRSLHRNPAWHDKRLTTNGLWRIVKLYGVALKYPGLSPHKLRHTVVTQLIKMGYALPDIQKVTGHARIETLMIYADNVEDKQGQLTDALSNLWDEKPTKKGKK